MVRIGISIVRIGQAIVRVRHGGARRGLVDAGARRDLVDAGTVRAAPLVFADASEVPSSNKTAATTIRADFVMLFLQALDNRTSLRERSASPVNQPNAQL
jgi:hypothetical protein